MPQVPLRMRVHVRMAPPLLLRRLPQRAVRSCGVQDGQPQRQAQALYRQHEFLVAVEELLWGEEGRRQGGERGRSCHRCSCRRRAA